MNTWRSRDFALPLVVTLGGAAASYVFANSTIGDCQGSGCAYLATLMIVQWLVAFVPGLVATGFLVSIVSKQTPLALRGILVGLAVLGIPVIVLAAVPYVHRGDALDVVRVVTGAITLALLLLACVFVPVALGFGVGRLVRRGLASVR